MLAGMKVPPLDSPTLQPTTAKPDLATLIAHWRDGVISPKEIESLVDQVGRLISWRLQRVHGRGYGWHDLHQECWLSIARALADGTEWTGKPSTRITAIVDDTVKQEHQAHRLNTWDCTIEAIKRINGKMVEHGVVVIEQCPVGGKDAPRVGTLGD